MLSVGALMAPNTGRFGRNQTALIPRGDPKHAKGTLPGFFSEFSLVLRDEITLTGPLYPSLANNAYGARAATDGSHNLVPSAQEAICFKGYHGLEDDSQESVETN